MGTLTSENLEKLVRLNDNIKNLISNEPELDNALDLSGRLNGVFGEALGLAKLYSIYGNSANYEWEGKQKKGYDIQITKNNEKIRFQIKSSAQEKYVFRVIKVADLDAEKIRKQLANKDFSEIFNKITYAIDHAQTDVWLLIHTRKDKHDFYWIEKEAMKDIVTKHYEDAFTLRKHGRKGKEFHEYITNGIYRPHITQNEKWDRERLAAHNKIKVIEEEATTRNTQLKTLS
ncbi:MAG: hypothetical protein ABSG33_08175 [Candidatus Bathyarchaeia archaeon]|jgi:hypothetical protein